jgi:hypothetical protein
VTLREAMAFLRGVHIPSGDPPVITLAHAHARDLATDLAASGRAVDEPTPPEKILRAMVEDREWILVCGVRIRAVK